MTSWQRKRNDWAARWPAISPARGGSRQARRAISFWASGGERARRNFPGRRQGGQECYGLRFAEAPVRLVGYAGGDDRSHRSRSCRRPKREVSVGLAGLDHDAAVHGHERRASNPRPRFQPRPICRRFCALAGQVGSQTLLRLEGIEASVKARAAMLKALLSRFGDPVALEGRGSQAAWAAIRDARPLETYRNHLIWRLSVPANSSARVMRSIREAVDAIAYFCDWAGGSHLACGAGSTARPCRTVRAAVAACGGHATLFRAPRRFAGGAGVRAAAGRPCRAHAAGEEPHSIRCASSTAAACMRGCDANELLRPRSCKDPKIAEANQILRTCVHCGFCTATCPTYVLLGDELDSRAGASISSRTCSKTPARRRPRSSSMSTGACRASPA